jgi:hypothetical protein
MQTFSGRKTEWSRGAEGKLRDDDKLSQFESSGDDFFAERSHVVLVCVADLLDQTVRSESSEQA